MKIIKVDVSKLILADYNPRIKLKPGDRAYEEVNYSPLIEAGASWSIFATDLY